MGLSNEDWYFLVGIVVLVMLFMGPGLWSNHEEAPITYLWRKLRGQSAKKPKADPP